MKAIAEKQMEVGGFKIRARIDREGFLRVNVLGGKCFVGGMNKGMADYVATRNRNISRMEEGDLTVEQALKIAGKDRVFRKWLGGDQFIKYANENKGQWIHGFKPSPGRPLKSKKTKAT